ncbi:MAG: ShlB/FhaC/HecB family hemolysin secretion/activation protein, partial [Crocosphaera sp.]
TVQLGSDNNRTPSVGSNRRGIFLSEKNLFGNGEQLEASYFNSEGSNSGYVGLTIPITQDGTLRVESGLTDNKIVERPFDVLDLNTESRYYQVFLRQPVLKSPYDEVGLGLIFSRIESESYLDGFRFPLSRGASERGETRINAVRLVQDWTSNRNEQIIFLRSQLSFGLNLDGTSDFEPDSEFFHWNLQGQYLRQLAPDTLFIVRGELQQSDQELFPDEQFRAGGGATVRAHGKILSCLIMDCGLWLKYKYLC